MLSLTHVQNVLGSAMNSILSQDPPSLGDEPHANTLYVTLMPLAVCLFLVCRRS